MADLVRVTGDFGVADDSPAEGRVWFGPWLDAVLVDPDPVLVTKARVEVRLDESGAFSVDLYGSHDPAWQTDGPVPYLVRWAVSGSYAERVFLIPDGPGPFDLFTLVDLKEPPTIVPTPVPGPPGPTAVSGDPGNAATLGTDNLLYVPPLAGITDHGALTGLTDPDHPIAAVQGLQAALDGKAPVSHSHGLGDLPGTLATDAEVAAAISAHTAALDPHPQYLSAVEGNAAYEPAGAVAAHAAAADPHPGYLKPAELVQGANVVLDTATTPGSVIINAPAATEGPPGPAGPPGTAYLSAAWNFNQNTTAPPNSGTMRMNATTYAAATQLWVHEVDRDGLDRQVGLGVAVPGDQIIMQSAQGRAVWEVTGQADSGVYHTLTVTLVESSGSRPSASSQTTLYFATGGSEVVNLDDLADVDVAGAANGSMLRIVEGTWVAADLPTGLQTRATASKTTATLAAGASEQGTVALAPGYRLYRITTSAPARVRLYTTAAARDADASRPIGTDPGGGSGLMLEFVATAGLLAADLSPTVDGFDGKATPDGAIPVTIENRGATTQTVTVTLVWIRSE